MSAFLPNKSNLNILLDAGPSKSKKPSGIGQHAYNLYLSLKKISNCRISTYEYLNHIPPVVKRFSYQIIANLEYIKFKYNILHFLTHYVPFTKTDSKKVVTIHDLIPFRFPETIPTLWRSYNRKTTKQSIERSNAIITLSTFVKDEILNIFPYIDEKKIFVCGGGLRDIFYNYEASENDLVKINIKPYEYFLFVGDLTTRKNLSSLIDAFGEALQNKGISANTKLILSGKPAYGYTTIKNKLSSSKNIITLGYVPDEAMVALYKYAKAFIFPSLYEGYGMVLLEALSQNCPIIVSNIPSSNELNNVNDKQMLIFDLNKPADLVNYLVEIDKNYLHYRSKLIHNGLHNFSYDNVAINHVEVYKHIINL